MLILRSFLPSRIYERKKFYAAKIILNADSITRIFSLPFSYLTISAIYIVLEKLYFYLKKIWQHFVYFRNV